VTAQSTPTADLLAAVLEEYLTEHPAAAVLEDGRVAFDMRSARYSVAGDHGRCLLQLWSEERNLIRTVVGVEERRDCLRVLTRRMGTTRPQALELVPTNERRTPTAREAGRKNYQRLLERILGRQFIGSKVDGFRSAMDLEHSFGPAYVRGRLLKGAAAEAVIGISAAEPGPLIDGILTLGLLWLDYCRQHTDGRRHFGGLKLIVPEGAWRTTAERLAWMNHAAARFELYTLNERSEELAQIDWQDTGNLASALVHAYSAEAAVERCREGLDELWKIVPEGARSRVEVRPRSSTEVGLALHGLEFGRVRVGASAHSFAPQQEVTFGAGANETPLDAASEALARALVMRLFHSRHADGQHTDALFRLQPEKWLESEFRRHLGTLLPGLRGDLLYTQVPALSAGERGMLDLLTLDRQNRLVVMELKANEDLHLPLQALDYWIRVHALNADRQNPAGGSRAVGAFERHGYFQGVEISARAPRLVLAAPALRIHPANETVLRYFAPEVEWELIALGEGWRHELKIVFRKRSTDGGPG
jgi:hypothetical protein